MNPTDSFLLFGFFDPEDFLMRPGTMGLSIREQLIVLGAITAVVAVVTAWIIFVRKRSYAAEHRHHRSHRHKNAGDSAFEASADTSSGLGGRKRRRRRRSHRPRNPTLAEVGGLPPLRSEDPPPPSQTQTQP